MISDFAATLEVYLDAPADAEIPGSLLEELESLPMIATLGGRGLDLAQAGDLRVMKIINCLVSRFDTIQEHLDLPSRRRGPGLISIKAATPPRLEIIAAMRPILACLNRAQAPLIRAYLAQLDGQSSAFALNGYDYKNQDVYGPLATKPMISGARAQLYYSSDIVIHGSLSQETIQLSKLFSFAELPGLDVGHLSILLDRCAYCFSPDEKAALQIRLERAVHQFIQAGDKFSAMAGMEALGQIKINEALSLEAGAPAYTLLQRYLITAKASEEEHRFNLPLLLALFKQAADLNMVTASQENILHLALRHGPENLALLIQELLKKGLTVANFFYAPDQQGIRPLDLLLPHLDTAVYSNFIGNKQSLEEFLVSRGLIEIVDAIRKAVEEAKPKSDVDAASAAASEKEEAADVEPEFEVEVEVEPEVASEAVVDEDTATEEVKIGAEEEGGFFTLPSWLKQLLSIPAFFGIGAVLLLAHALNQVVTVKEHQWFQNLNDAWDRYVVAPWGSDALEEETETDRPHVAGKVPARFDEGTSHHALTASPLAVGPAPSSTSGVDSRIFSPSNPMT